MNLVIIINFFFRNVTQVDHISRETTFDFSLVIRSTYYSS